MELYDINKLTKDSNQENLYNFFDPTFKMTSGFRLNKYIVSREEEMRIDLVSQSIYGSIDQVDFLLNINDIDNPLNIMEGDQLIYPEFGAIDNYRVRVIDNANARSILLNSNKSTKIDSNRKKYVDQDYSLPPTFLDSPEASAKIENNQIIIGI